MTLKPGLKKFFGLMLWMGQTLHLGCTRPPPIHLRVGVTPSIGCALLPLALEKKIFEQVKLQVEISSFTSLIQAQTMLADGRLDLFCSSLVELVQISALQKIDYKVILVPAASHGADVLIARKDLGHRLVDLKGARIGLVPDASGDLLLNRALFLQALSRDDFTVLTVDPADLLNALQKSEIQLAVAAPPLSLEILKNPDMQVMFRSSEMSADIIDTLSASPRVLQEHPKLIDRLHEAWQETVQFREEHPHEAIAFLGQKTFLPVRTLSLEYKFLRLSEQTSYLESKSRLPLLIQEIQGQLQKSNRVQYRREADEFLYIPTIK